MMVKLKNILGISFSKMIFTKEFLRELQQKMRVSDLYRMTKQSVEFLLKSKQLLDTDKYVIYDAIRNDIYQNRDPLLLKQFWNENIVDSNTQF